jgi:hypothetical protein
VHAAAFMYLVNCPASGCYCTVAAKKMNLSCCMLQHLCICLASCCYYDDAAAAAAAADAAKNRSLVNACSSIYLCSYLNC